MKRILLIVYDNESFIHYFPNGMAAIAAILRKNGHSVTIYDQAVNHYEPEHLTNYLNDNERFDIIGLGIIGGYWQYKKCLEISNSINNSKKRPNLYVLGGQLASPEPEFFLRKAHADVIIIGEGEIPIVEIADDKNFKDIKGIAYLDNNEFKKNINNPLIKDLDTLPFPAYDMFNISYYRLLREVGTNTKDFVLPIMSGRGCTHKCNFCYRSIPGFRPHSPERVVSEMDYLNKTFRINYFAFHDELTMNTEERMSALCEAILKHGFKDIKFNINGRLDVITFPLAKLLKRAGCVFVNYGIESFNDDMLKIMNKKLTCEQIVRGVEYTQKAGISTGLNVIFGNIGETKEHLKNTVDFVLKYSDFGEKRTIRPVQPYPGSDLYYYALKNNMLIDVEDFYNRNINTEFLSVNFTNMTDDEFHLNLRDANKILLNHHNRHMEKVTDEMVDDLYINKNKNFRGYRHSS